MRPIKGVEDLGVLRVVGQPNLNVTVDRDQASRYGMNISDEEDAIQTAVGGNPLSQVLIGEQRYDLVLRYLPRFRDTWRLQCSLSRLAGAQNQCSACRPGSLQKGIRARRWRCNAALAAQELR